MCSRRKQIWKTWCFLLLLLLYLRVLTFLSLSVTFNADYFVLLVIFEASMEDNLMLTEWQSSIWKQFTTFHHQMTDTCKSLTKIHQPKLLVVFARYHFMSTCWQEDPVFRPEFLHLRNQLHEFIEKEVMINVMKNKNSNLTMNRIVKSADIKDWKTGCSAWKLICTKPVAHSLCQA